MKKILLAAMFIAFASGESAQAWTLDAEAKMDQVYTPSKDQMLINKMTPMHSGIYTQRRFKKNWPSAGIVAPKKPRKKTTPDSMAVNEEAKLSH